MARDLDFEERRRQREEEDAREAEDQARKQGPGGKGAPLPAGKATGGDSLTGKIHELLERAEPLIEQVNSLYNQYLAGIERLAPVERRKHLDQLMESLQLMSKPTPSLQFRYSNVAQKYMTFRDRWDRMCKDLESGKIKRVTGARRG